MPKKSKVVSFRALGGYGDPLTELGVSLGEGIDLCVPRFLIYEFGLMRIGAGGWNNPDIISPFWRLYYNLQAGHWIEFAGRKFELTPEHIVVVPEGVLFDSHSQNNADHLWLHFSTLPSYAFRGNAPFLVAIEPLLREPIETSIALQRDTRATDRARRVYHSASALLHSVCALHPLPIRALPEELRRLLYFIEHAPGDALSNEQLARQVGLSKGCFSRWFREHTGATPAAYVRRARLDEACRMLAFTELSVEQVTRETGFANRYHFSRAFAAHTGCGPAAFRDRYQKRFEEVEA